MAETQGGDPFAPTYEEFTSAVQQMYPEQAARVIAELRAAKMKNYIDGLGAEAPAESSEAPGEDG